MEEDRNDIQTVGISNPSSQNTQDNDGEHQIEEQSNARDLAEPTEDDSKEVQGSSKAENDTNRTDIGNNEGPARSALAKKEERLKRLRELHLRRVRDCVCAAKVNYVFIYFFPFM